jgi:hypothetical protein
MISTLEEPMADSRAMKTGALLSAAMAVSAIIAQRAEAYPAASIEASAVTRPPITRIDDRSYRHCHNLPRGVVCYSSLSVTHKIKDPPERKPHQRPPNEIDGRHYRAHHRELFSE